MIASNEHNRHEEIWLLLPWLATGRLSASEREVAEEHVRHCSACEQELAVQHLMGKGFTEPDRVTYAPGPSFRKLMDRIDSEEGTESVRRPKSQPSWISRLSHVSLWRPPGLAWAASFLLMFGITGMMVQAYRWSQPLYATHTDTAPAPTVLHVALDRNIPIGEVEELLRAGGAQIVHGPDSTGVLGVTPVGASGKSSTRQLHALAERLRTDPRVLWIEPLADEGTPAEQRAPDALEH
ncbi:MAG: zf-HC2 domain-containing protein [Proteobacteria bacterium]|nr:zf-HC2 domain-containing protein [Pseudomonadota bacterium]